MKIIIAAVVIVTLVGGGWWVMKGKTPRVSGKADVTIDSTGFHPADFSLKKGQIVTWQNNDTVSHWPASDIHPTHQIYPEFDPKKGIEPGQSWTFRFIKAGIWRWHDHLYPDVTGTITVEE